MLSLLPGTTPQDLQGIVAILALVADPDAARKRVGELIDAANKLEAAIKSHGAEHEAALAAKDEAEKAHAALAGREAAVTSAEDSVRDIKSALDRREAELAAREKDHADAVSKKENDLVQREKNIAVDEAAAKKALDQAKADAGAAAALKAEYEQKLARLRSAVG